MSGSLAEQLARDELACDELACDEIACDESGAEGENLTDGCTDVFAHASVRMTVAAAADCVAEVRARIGSPATQYKANHLLRDRSRPVLTWLLGPSGPLSHRGHVVLVEKSFLLVTRLAQTLTGGNVADGASARLALAIYTGSQARLGPQRWQAALTRLNAALRGESGLLPRLDPLFPAVVLTAGYWSAGAAPVTLVHDRHTTLWPARVARLAELSAGGLAGLRQVDSRCDPRVQVADFLAGTARSIASAELAGRGDAELTALLRPYVDGRSVWGEQRSRDRLTGPCPCPRPSPCATSPCR